jgi:methylmalonyl-CoA/ethylmalonyl-CoA epimerase
MIGPAHHVGIAVRRLDDALARYRAFGFEPEEVEEVPSQGVRVAFLRAGDVRLEFLESLAPDGVIARFLERRGEGLHHLAFAVDDIRSELGRLKAAGLELVDAEPRPGAHGRLVAFVHPRSAQGVLVELVEVRPAASRQRHRQYR